MNKIDWFMALCFAAPIGVILWGLAYGIVSGGMCK